MIPLKLKFYDNVFLVGGAVRDYLLNRKIKDYDFVCACEEKDFKNIAFKFFKINFGIKPFLIGKTSPQTYRGIFNKIIIDLTIIEKNFDFDAKRRDFTINSIYYDFKNQNFIDPLKGIQDLENKKIKVCSNDSISLDPLRILRAFRFFAELDKFKIEFNTLNLIINQKHLLSSSAKERIKEEIDKIILSSKCYITFKLIKNFKILESVIREINWNNLLLLKKISNNLSEFEKKVFTYSILFEKSLKMLKPSGKELKAVKEIKKNYSFLLAENLNKKNLMEFIYHNRKYFDLIFKFVKTFYKTPHEKTIEYCYQRYLQKEKDMFELINGNDLIDIGLNKGKLIGEALDKVRILYLLNKISSKKEALDYVKKNFLN